MPRRRTRAHRQDMACPVSRHPLSSSPSRRRRPRRCRPRRCRPRGSRPRRCRPSRCRGLRTPQLPRGRCGHSMEATGSASLQLVTRRTAIPVDRVTTGTGRKPLPRDRLPQVLDGPSEQLAVDADGGAEVEGTHVDPRGDAVVAARHLRRRSSPFRRERTDRRRLPGPDARTDRADLPRGDATSLPRRAARRARPRSNVAARRP
jgi:hypothetical protein